MRRCNSKCLIEAVWQAHAMRFCPYGTKGHFLDITKIIRVN